MHVSCSSRAFEAMSKWVFVCLRVFLWICLSVCLFVFICRCMCASVSVCMVVARAAVSVCPDVFVCVYGSRTWRQETWAGPYDVSVFSFILKRSCFLKWMFGQEQCLSCVTCCPPDTHVFTETRAQRGAGQRRVCSLNKHKKPANK